MTHRFDPILLREYDVRGVVGQSLGPADARAIGRCFATIVRRADGRAVAVGRDGRLSSPRLEEALIEGLLAGGVDVHRIGLAATPMLYFAEATLGVDGAIQLTGSHNPVDHNGFKMVLGHRPFFGPDIAALAPMAAAGDWSEGRGRLHEASLMDAYIARLLQDFDGPALRIGWDAGNGAAGPAIERLTARLPGEHHLLFTEVDGRFPNHHPDPTIEANLADLRALVRDRQLDFGLAFDGDGDRLVAVDGQGRVLHGDQLLAILAEPVLRNIPGATVIADVKAFRATCNRISELGGKPLIWKTGHSWMKQKMIETGAPLAGETTGHLFFADDYFGFDDALYAALRLIAAVGSSGRSLSQLRDDMPEVAITPEMRFQVAEDRKFAVVAEVAARLAAAGVEANLTDGVRVDTAEGWWLLRASNTQDALVARAEAKDAAGLKRLVGEIDAQLAQSGLARGPGIGH